MNKKDFDLWRIGGGVCKMERDYLSVPFQLKAEDIDPDGTFKGYGSTFDGRPDSHKDIIRKGAFKETIKKKGRNGNGIAMLWQHDSTRPIGTWSSLIEDDIGLKVEGQLILEVQQAKEAHALMKQGALKGLSIGWDFPRDKDGKAIKDSYEFDDETGIRYLKRIELWEISPVTFASNIRARITSVKELIENAKTPRELEKALRDAGLSLHTAKYVAGLTIPSLRDAGNVDKSYRNGLAEVLANLKKVNIDLQSQRQI